MPATSAMAINAMNSTWCIIFLAISYFNHKSSTLAVKQTVFVKEGLTVDLSCPFQAATNPIIWRGPPNLKRYSIDNKINSHIGKLDKISVNGNLTTQKYNLSISNFTKTDAGLYRCETILNETSKRHEIEVRLAVSPVVRVNVEPSSVVEERHYFTLTCLYDSNTNESVIRWKRNDRILINTQNRNLSVINVSREDAGKYCCEVKNRIGIGTDMINITVLYKPIVMSHSNTLEIESDFEKPSFISFTIASGTKPNISWTNVHGGKIGYWNVQDIGEEIFNVSSTIFPLGKSHLGLYSVRVQNKIGSINMNIELVDVSFSEPNITRKEGLRNNTSKTAIHWSIYVLSGVFLTVVVMIITISVLSDRKLLQKYAKQGVENVLQSQQEMGTRISSPSATCHSYEEVDYHALECRNFNGNASLPVNNALSVKTYASFESRDSKKTKDCTF